MKSFIKIFFCSMLFFVSSCYSDQSNKEINAVNPITVYINGIKYPSAEASTSISAFFQGELKVEPLVLKEGTNDAKLKFSWEISGNGIAPKIVGTSMSLNYVVDVAPQSYAYSLMLSITDTQTQIQRHVIYSLTVMSSFAEGLIVADTKDEVTSDLSLLVAMNFNSAVAAKDTKVTKDLWSKINGAKINGIVKDIRTSSYGTNRSLTILTENDLIRADHYDYIKKPEESGFGIFIVPPKELKPDFIGYDSSWGQELMSVNGRLFPRSCQNGVRLYSFYMFLPDYSDYKVSHFYNVKYRNSWMFDVEGERLIMQNGTSLIQFKDQDPTMPFNVNNFKDCTPYFMGQTSASDLHLVVKKDGKFYDYVMYCNVKDDGKNVPKHINDLANCTDIDKAKYFATCMLEDVLYYATDDKIYASPLNSRNPTSELRYTANAGEKITNISVWSDNQGAAGKIYYKNINPDISDEFLILGANDRMMIITTYNESSKEGKLITVPIVTLGIGGLEQDRNYHNEYGGFGRITKYAKQLK